MRGKLEPWRRTLWLSITVAVLAFVPPARAAAPDLATDSQTASPAPLTSPGAPSSLRPPELPPDLDDDAKAEAPAKKPAKPRKGGINPCNTPDPGFGIYEHWSRNVSMGQILAPQRGGLTKGGGFDLIVHFHGHEAIRKEFIKVANGVVLVGIDLGIGSGVYGQSFAAPHVFEKLLESVEREMARRNGREKAFVRKLALSSWSAGYGAIDQILRQPAAKKVDAVILLDSLHAGYADENAEDLGKRLKTVQIEPFLAFARKAAGGGKMMFESFSSIPPPGYGSTREVAQYIVGELGGKLRKSRRDDVLGLEMLERFDRGGYHVRGYDGDDKPDHCAHLGLIRDVLRVHLKPRWKSPRGRAGKPAAETSVAKAKVEPRKGNAHVVQNGESLGRIARRYHVSVKALREANGLKPHGRKIQPGDQLVIPPEHARPKESAPKESAKKESAKKESAPKESAPKESAPSISLSAAKPAEPKDDKPKADKPKDDAKEKAKDKDKPKDKRHAGGAPRPGERLHKVEKGEALIPIAKRYGITVKALRERNGLRKNGRSIQPGEQLIIPAAN